MAAATVAAVMPLRSALADDESAQVGQGPGALPGAVRVRAATPGQPGPLVSSWAGYGYRGPVLDADDGHHRAAGGLAIGLGHGDWLTAALRLDGRYDRHVDLPEGSDDGWVGEPRLSVLARRSVGGPVHLGGELSIWFPGEAAPSVVLDAISAELSGIASVVPRSVPVVVSGNLGLRIDRSAAAIDDPDALSLADRMALGLSDSNAVLVGLAVTHRRGPLELAGEWSWDLLVGDEAPDVAASPMRLAATARHRLSGSLLVQAIVEVGLSEAPQIARGMPLSPVEPRLTVHAGLQYRFGGSRRVPPVLDREPPPPLPALGAVEGQVRSTTGGPLPGAEVVIIAGGRQLTAVAGPDGRFEIGEVPVGPARVRAAMADHDPAEVELEIRPGSGNPVELVLAPILPRGQLRGMVRSFAGKPIAATLVLEPTGDRTVTDDTGYFEIDVVPGTYQVVIEAEGYAAQRREVRIEERGVTILNVDLRKR